MRNGCVIDNKRGCGYITSPSRLRIVSRIAGNREGEGEGARRGVGDAVGKRDVQRRGHAPRGGDAFLDDNDDGERGGGA